MVYSVNQIKKVKDNRHGQTRAVQEKAGAKNEKRPDGVVYSVERNGESKHTRHIHIHPRVAVKLLDHVEKHDDDVMHAAANAWDCWDWGGCRQGERDLNDVHVP